jgi:hypothetical protein
VVEETQSALAVSAVSTRLLVQLTRAGAAEVVVAVEEPGVIAVSNRLKGNYAYEVTAGGKLLAAAGFTDPFIRRPMGNGGYDLPQMAETGTVVVSVPGMGLADTGYEVAFHQFVAPIHAVVDLDTAAISSLSQRGMIRSVGRLEPARIAAAVAARGNRSLRAPQVGTGIGIGP